ncbi:thioredoxin domain-containing protein [Sulfitobacter geojensis]|uniref:thioredoxin domain-containing protein n=1 Tax=Sulfitobacter geojensis TaxID=1342299 RepID=UPI0036DAC742
MPKWLLSEYASFTCPHCAAFHSGPFKQLKADFIDTGKIKFIYREVYFDRPGLWASMIARCQAVRRNSFRMSQT